MLHLLMLQPIYDKSVEYYDNRISHFSAQWGKCAVTGKSFETLSEIHCHHIVPKEHGGTDKYDNLVLITSNVHRLIHAKTHETIEKYRVIPWLFPHGLMDTCMNIPPTLVYTKYKLFCAFCQALIRKYQRQVNPF